MTSTKRPREFLPETDLSLEPLRQSRTPTLCCSQTFTPGTGQRKGRVCLLLMLQACLFLSLHVCLFPALPTQRGFRLSTTWAARGDSQRKQPEESKSLSSHGLSWAPSPAGARGETLLGTASSRQRDGEQGGFCRGSPPRQDAAAEAHSPGSCPAGGRIAGPGPARQHPPARSREAPSWPRSAPARLPLSPPCSAPRAEALRGPRAPIPP